jgi:hypothetical protein
MNTKFYLPCEYGKSLKCTQGNGGGFSHTGKAYYAYDFISNETTHFNICSTADGVVKKVQDSHSQGGVVRKNNTIDIKASAKKYPANYILIYHASDNCYSLYYHIQYHSAKVKVGDNVKQGQMIAKAGKVGVATGVHLHFQIQKENSSWGKSISFDFEESDTITSGSSYKSQNRYHSFAANYQSQASYPKLVAGGKSQEWWIEFKNTGLETWENHNKNNKITKLALGTFSNPDMFEGREFQCDWESETRLAVVEPSTVKPNEIGKFVFKLKAPESITPGKYKLYVTPKSPAGWLKQDDGAELNCFAEIEVTEKEKISDLFSNNIYNQIGDMCQQKSDDTPFVYSDSGGLKDFVVPNADIKNVQWDRDQCKKDEDVTMNINCHDGVPDGSAVWINVFHENSDKPLTLPNEYLNGIIKNNNAQITLNTDLLYQNKKSDLDNNYYFTATIKDGDKHAAQSKQLRLNHQKSLQIIASTDDGKSYHYAQRRFVYCWEKPKDDNQWLARGILMTDDNGVLFDMPLFVYDSNQFLNDLNHAMIDRFENGKWAATHWNFFGEGEDLYAFQKWIGTIAAMANYDETTQFETSIIKESDIFQFQFYINKVNKKYICRFDDDSAYFLMYYPPDIVESIPINFNNNSNEIKSISPFSTNHWNQSEWKNSTPWSERNSKAKIRDIWLKQENDNVNTTKFGTLLKKSNVSFEGSNVTFRIIEGINFSQHVPANSFVIDLPLTLEEELSNLQLKTIFLDLQFKILIESNRNFLQAASKMSEINEILELMKLYPGFKDYEYSDRYSYKQRIYPSENDKTKINNTIKSINEIQKVLLKAGFSDDNPVFKEKKQEIVGHVRDIESCIESQRLKKKIEEWFNYTTKYKDVSNYPFIMRFSNHGPYLFKIISEAFYIILGLDFSIDQGREKTIGDAFYKKHLLPFENDLERKYHAFNKKYATTQYIKRQLIDQNIITDEEYLKDIFSENSFVVQKDKSILKIVFQDTLFKKIVPNIWHNQVGPESYITGILKLGTVYRSMMSFARCAGTNISATFFHTKVMISHYVYHNRLTNKQIEYELNQAVQYFAKKRNNLQNLIKTRQQMKNAFSNKNFGRAPVMVSRLVSAIGVFVAAYDIYRFYNKIQRSEEITITDVFEFSKSINSGCIALTGFGIKQISKIQVFAVIGNKVLKFVKFLNVVFLWIDILRLSLMALSDYEEGEVMICRFRWAQAALLVFEGLSPIVALFIEVPVVNAFLIIGLGLVIAIEAGISIERHLRPGVENAIKAMRKELIKLPIFDGILVVPNMELGYILKGQNTIINYSDKHILLNQKTENQYKAYIETIKKAIQELDYWNLDILKAGSVLYNKGYSIYSITYICLKKEKNISTHFKDEFDHIKRFAEMELFEPEESLKMLARRITLYKDMTLEQVRNIEYSKVVEYSTEDRIFGSAYDVMKVRNV